MAIKMNMNLGEAGEIVGGPETYAAIASTLLSHRIIEVTVEKAGMLMFALRSSILQGGELRDISERTHGSFPYFYFGTAGGKSRFYSAAYAKQDPRSFIEEGFDGPSAQIMAGFISGVGKALTSIIQQRRNAEAEVVAEASPPRLRLKLNVNQD